MKRVGIFGGSFNPVHSGHVALAEWLVCHDYVDEVWLMLSPQNPLKGEHSGATDAHRREMLRLACEKVDGLKPCYIEFDLPRPSYTIDTLRRLSADYPDYDFKLIIGSDNWLIFDKWRNFEFIIRDFGVIVYPRPNYPILPTDDTHVQIAEDAPVIEVSSTKIRENIAENLLMLPSTVAKYIIENSLYGYFTK